MCVDALAAGSSGPGSFHAPALYFAFSVFGVIVAALAHWRFRTGWHMRSGFMKPSDAFYETYVCLLYAALPTLVAMAGMTGALAFGNLANDHPVGLPVDLFLLSAIVMLAGAAWATKEFFKPSERRTPDWLRATERHAIR
jgi:hypothetical protein